MSALTDPGNFLLVPVEDDDAELLTAAANAGHTGAMIALIPSDADLQRLAAAGDEPADQLHLTLAFLGEAALIDDDTRERIVETARGYFSAPVATEATNVIVLNPHTTEYDTALAVGIRGMDLVGPRENIMSAVRGVYPFEETFKPWLPHVTMARTDDITRVRDFADQLGPITFDKIRFAFGDEVRDIPLGQTPLTAAFRESDHPRDADGKFVETGRWGDAANGTLAYLTAPSTKRLAGDDINKEAAVVDYQISGHTEINHPLRASGGVSAMDSKQTQRTLDALDSMMAEPKAQLAEDIIVLRGAKDPFGMFGRAWSPFRSNEGLTWKDHGFLSTTTDPETADHFMSENSHGAGQPVFMRILAPKGTRALRLESRQFEQNEILLDRGQTYRIVRQDRRNGVITLDVEIVEGNN